MFRQLRRYGVVPVVSVETPEQGVRLCAALCEAGLPVAEITFRTAAAEATIRAAAVRFPDMLLGAGTVLTVDQAKRAAAAGARFAMAPGTNPTVVEASLALGLPFAPGVCTPSDIERALACGVTTLKFFPAEAAGGVQMLRALTGPYGHLGVEFCPTGGIDETNMGSYLALPQVALVGGSWMVRKEWLAAGQWSAITESARQALAKAARG
jgi:2-dehydro-3-deoxyphosphogluconate aldolase / (4S)-4-hydroxy-2-oxoglutarate aldolase